MGQVRWAGWTMAIATAVVISGAQARADVASDRPAAIVVYPKIVVDTSNGVDTVIRLTNTNLNNLVDLHCFYIDANSHCTNDPSTICADSSDCCSGTSCGTCVPSCLETDFDIVLTQGQPIEWKASDGVQNSDLPLPYGVCAAKPTVRCGTGDDCTQRNAGSICTASNSGTLIPPVSENPFVGELKCIETNADHVPVASNDLKGEAIIETATTSDLDVASYNAIGIKSTANNGSPITHNPLILGPGSSGDYNGCPNVLILDNFSDQALDPVSGAMIQTDLTLVTCSEDLLRQVEGSATVQYLVYNEFEERYSTSRAITCFQEIWLCNIDTPNCSRSIFNVAAMGTLTAQTRINPVVNPAAALPSGLLGVAIENHGGGSSAAFNLHFAGSRDTADTITLP